MAESVFGVIIVILPTLLPGQFAGGAMLHN